MVRPLLVKERAESGFKASRICDFDVENQHGRGREKVFEDAELEGFLHRIVTGDEKCVHYNNPKRRKSWGYPSHASTLTVKPNIHGSKDMLSIYGQDILGNIEMGSSTPSAVFSRHCSLFRSMAHGLADQHFWPYEEVKNWIDSWIASKDDQFFQRGIRTLPERWEKIVASDGQCFES
ncbi:Mariner Mos1 transposase [Eumeta japonica]|uniref:Mariner Mos1 transposase n=1 Tax=Eumeta variegata TaxID=151549 RepID=A0A4C1WI07_EUMVA|nr:Mariner Mos1 transposase [Eumeta japonica]